MQLWRDLDPAPRRAFLALLLAVVLSSAGFGAIFPVLPLLVTGRGNGVEIVAVMAAAFIITSFALQYPMAALADRFGRRRVLGAALLLNAGAALLYLLHGGPPLLVGARLLQGVADGAAEPAARGLVSDLVPDERRGEAFGAVASAEMLGILVGPLFGGGIAAVFPLEYVFILEAAASLAAGVSFLVFTRRLPRAVHAASGVARAFSAGFRLLLTVDMVGLGLLVAAGTYLFGLYDTVWVLFMQKLGAGAALTGLSITVFAAPLLVLGPVAGRLGDRYGRRVPAVVCTLAVGVIAATYPLLPGIPWVMAMGAVEGTMFAFIDANLYALIAAAAPEGMEARAQAAAGVLGIAGTMVAPALAAFFWTRDYHLAFYSGAAFVLVFGLVGAVLVLRPGSGVGSRRVPSTRMPAIAEPRAPAVSE
ncbi:MAG TPA: MFS transporter [Candidatus Dormibacteraeota bacterium]|nr:MFS transporter [Candidatus Dormibacteraeota bacterium]